MHIALADDNIVISNEGKHSGGKFKYHYDEAIPNTCETVIILGVGTFMKVDNYDNLSSEIVRGKSILVIIADHNPGGMTKYGVDQFTTFVDEMLESLGSLIPICCADVFDNSSTGPKRILVGGHSASGYASLKSITKTQRTPDGFIGLDPYLDFGFGGSSTTDEMKISIPSLNWGFATATCGVDPTKSILLAYHMSKEDSRVLFQVQNKDKDICHCIFADQGCPYIWPRLCPAKKNGSWVHLDVAKSIHNFLQSISSGEYDKSSYSDIIDGDRVNLFVNGDETQFNHEGDEHWKWEFTLPQFVKSFCWFR